MVVDTLLRALNHLLNGAAWATTRLKPFAGQQVRIEGLPFPVLLAIADDGRFTTADASQTAAVTISLPSDFAVLFLVDREKIFGNARLAGAADLAETLAFIFRNLEWDVESDLADVVGDIAAHRLVRAGRHLHQWQATARRNLMANVAEYLGEEARVVVTPPEIASFSRAIATLRDDLDRLEKRLKRLEA